MTKNYEVRVTMTGKTIGSNEGYSIFHEERKEFATIAEVKKYLNDQYGTCKRQKIYVDVDTHGDESTRAVNDGDSVTDSKHVGYIYCFKNSDISHDNKPWYQQDWVTVNEIKRTVVIVK